MHDGPAGGGRRGDGRKKRSGMIAMRPNGRLEATLLALRPRAIDTVSQGCAPMVPVGVVAAETAPTSRTRVAIIGLGRQGSTICDEQPAGSPPYGIAGACRQSSVLEIVAGADIQLDKRLAFQERWGCKIPGESNRAACMHCVLTAAAHLISPQRSNSDKYMDGTQYLRTTLK